MKKRSKRKHIPPLNPAELAQALQRLQDARLPPAAKRQLEAMMRAAANPANESVEVVIKTMPRGRREQIQSTTADLNKSVKAVTGRAKKALLEMPDDEWERLVEEANGSK